MRSADTELLHQILDAQILARPDEVAVRDERAELTYRELDRRSSGLAAVLRAHGVGPEVPVGVRLGRSVDLLTAFFAVLRAGGVYVPLDPENPADRLAWLVSDAGLDIAVIDTEEQAGLPADVTTIPVGDAATWPEATSDDGPAPSSENLAYIVYTSGSTGRPKGVMVSHRNAVGLVHAQRAADLVPAGSSVLGFASIGFDASVWEMLLAVGHGAVLHYVTGRVEELSAVSRCVATLVPSVLETVEPSGVDFSSVISAGESLSAGLAARWSQRQPVRNAYGPTEATIWASLSEVLTDFSRAPSIGRARAGSSLHVLDIAGQPVASGETGELWIGGTGVARGYRGMPGLTAARFRPDPWGQPGSRLYGTGDLARQRDDGGYEFLGRRDDQVKINGRRVELGEIESALTGLDGIASARVVFEKTPENRHRLVAAVTPADLALSDGELTALLSSRLPDFMVPAAVVRVDQFPLTVNGKLDASALVARAQSEPDQPETLDHPAEELVAALWAEVLGVDRVGLKDHFFTLGGHSLLATRLVARLRSVLRSRLSMRVLFQAPVLRDFLDTALARGVAERPYDDEDAAYWQEVLADSLPVLGLPPVSGRLQPPEFRSSAETALAPELVAEVAEFARREALTPFAVYVAAFATALAQHTGSGTVVVGASRRIRAAAGPGATTALLPVVTPKVGPTTDTVASVRSGILAAYLHQELPRSLSGTATAGAQDGEPTVLVPEFLLSLSGNGIPPLTVASACHLALTETATGLYVQLHVAVDAFDRSERLEDLTARFVTAIRQMTETTKTIG